MEKQTATAAGSTTATTTERVAPAEATRAAVVEGMNEVVDAKPAPEAAEATATTEETKTTEAAEATEAKTEETTTEDAEEDKALTPRAKEILQQRIDKMTAKTKAEIETAAAEAAAAKAEADKLREQLDPQRREDILKTGLLPELLEPAQAATLKAYDNALAGMQSAKDIYKRSRAMIEAGTHVDEAGQEKVFEGTGFDGKPFKGTARQWRDVAEDARDAFEPQLRELAPQATGIKRETATRQAEIYRLGLAAWKQREAAAKKVATVAGDKTAAPVKVEVKAAAGTVRQGLPKSQKQQALERFYASPKSRDDINAAMASIL